MREERRVSESQVEIVHMVRPNHLNAAGRLFGGMLMEWLDEAAGMVAMRHTRSNVITASVDNLRFIHGAYNGEIVVIIGKVTYVGTTSLEVRLDTYVEHIDDGMRYPINRAYFTMVALDENDKPKRRASCKKTVQSRPTARYAVENGQRVRLSATTGRTRSAQRAFQGEAVKKASRFGSLFVISFQACGE